MRSWEFENTSYMPKPLIILEGPDCAGKTTLAKRYIKLYKDAIYVHFDASPGVGSAFSRMHVEAMMPALLGHRPVIMDRAWPSERVYSAVFRNGSTRITSLQQRMLDRLAMRCQLSFVLCLPPLNDCLKKWRERKGAGLEYLDTQQQLANAHQLYERFDRTGEFSTTNYTLHNYKTAQPNNIYGYDCRPGHPEDSPYSTGNVDAPVMIVCESIPKNTTCDAFQMFAGTTLDAHSPWSWITKKIESAGIPERDLLWVTADNPSVKHNLFRQDDRRKVILLGPKAADLFYKNCPDPDFVDDADITELADPCDEWLERFDGGGVSGAINSMLIPAIKDGLANGDD